MDIHGAAVLATISKHDIAGIVGVIVGILLIVFSVFKIIAKAAGAMIFLGVGAAAILVAILMFSRSI
jgi:hypothetical protein